MPELISRIRSVLDARRFDGSGSLSIRLGSIEVWADSGHLRKNDVDVPLGHPEREVLKTLARNRNLVVTPRLLTLAAWKTDSEKHRDRLRQSIKDLRGKLEDDPAVPRRLVTEPGIGYRLVVSEG